MMNVNLMKINRNKKGVTHFEIIVALILFILAVFGSLALYNSYFRNGSPSFGKKQS